MTFALRDYQLDAISRIREEFNRGQRRGIAHLLTGLGKTSLACNGFVEPCISKGKRAVFVAHTQELLDQTGRKLSSMGLDFGVIKADDHRTDYRKPLQLASVQTLVKRVKKARFQFDLIVVDEAHLSMAKTWMDAIDACAGGSFNRPSR